MRKNITLRLILSGLLLLVASVYVIRDGEKLYSVFELFPSRFYIVFTNFPSPSIVGTIFLGYLFSFTTTLAQPNIRFPWLRIASLSISGIALASYTNEIFRLFINYNLRFVVHLPLLLVMVDWISYFATRKASPPAAATVEA
jgi:hypothetical protein